MNHDHLARIVTGALLSGGIALAGFGLASATAHAMPVTNGTFAEFRVEFNPQPEPPGRPNTNQQPESPGSRVGFDPQPEPPGSRVGFNPQPEPPTRVIIAVNPG